jgi:phenylacetate-CoA ligase
LSHTSDAIASQELKKTLAPILPSDKTIYWQRFEFPQDFYRATLTDAKESTVISNLLLSEMTSDRKARLLLDIFNSKRWIFYRLPACLTNIVTQLEERSDCLNGESSLLIDRIILLMKVLGNNADIKNTVATIWTRHRLSINAGNANSLYLDLFAISLFLPDLDVFALAAKTPENITVDSISYRIIFAVVRQAIQNVRRRANPPLITRLTPLLPLFVSDLEMYGSKALLEVLVHWAILLGCLSKESLKGLKVSRPIQLLLREKFLLDFAETSDRNSIDLSSLDASELLEIAIQLVISNTPIEPFNLLKAIQRHQQSNLTSKMRFVSFMRFLAERFLERGEREKAYSCLLVSKDISEMQDAFEFSTQSYNFKQKIFW